MARSSAIGPRRTVTVWRPDGVTVGFTTALTSAVGADWTDASACGAPLVPTPDTPGATIGANWTHAADVNARKAAPPSIHRLLRCRIIGALQRLRCHPVAHSTE